MKKRLSMLALWLRATAPGALAIALVCFAGLPWPISLILMCLWLPWSTRGGEGLLGRLSVSGQAWRALCFFLWLSVLSAARPAVSLPALTARVSLMAGLALSLAVDGHVLSVLTAAIAIVSSVSADPGAPALAVAAGLTVFAAQAIRLRGGKNKKEDI